MKPSFLSLAALLFLVVAAHGGDLVPTITFQQSSDYDQNFFPYLFVGGPPPYAALYDANGYLTKGTRYSAATLIYDTAPDTIPTNNQFLDFAMDVDFRATSRQGGISLFFHSLNSRQKALAVDFNLFTIGPFTNSYSLTYYEDFGPSIGYLGFLQSQTTYPGAFDTWLHLNLEVHTAGTHTTATTSVYNSQTIFTPATLIASSSFDFLSSFFSVPGELGVSLHSSGPYAVSADNFSVSRSVPEPSTIMYVYLTVLGLVGRRSLRRTGPNHALQRTAPCVTVAAPRRPTAQLPRRTPLSLSLGSLGDLP